jgi:hypothetical protein
MRFVYFGFYALNKPTLIGDRKIIVGLPAHAKIVSEQKERLQKNYFFICVS